MNATTARIVIAATDQTAGAFKSAQAGLAELQRRAATIGSAFGALGPQVAAAFSVPVLATFARNTINAIDALNDVADATGSTVEQISSLENVARSTGRTLDDVGSILIKFNQALASADGKNGLSQALRAIGLDARELRALDPADALERAAKALAGFADDGNKARIVQELFGKSIRDAAPFLKDLAERGRENATITTDQAAAAAKFNKELAAIGTNAGNAGRSITTFFLPALSAGAERLATWSGELKGARDLLRQIATFSPAGALVDSFRANFGSDRFSEIERLTRLVERYQKAVEGGDRRPQLLAELATARAALAAVQLPQATYSNEGRNAIRRLPDLAGGDPPPVRPGAPPLPPVARFEDYGQRISEAVAGAINSNAVVKARELVDQIAKLDELFFTTGLDAEVYQAALDRLTGVTRGAGAVTSDFLDKQQRLRDLLAQTPTAALERTREDMQLLATAFTEGRLSVEAYTEAVQTRLGTLPQVAGPALEQISEFAKQAERNIQNALGDTLKRTLTGDFKSIGQLWRNLLIDMASQALAADLGRKLFPNGPGGGGSIFASIFSLLGFAKGGAFDRGKVIPFASGGIVGSPTLFPMAGGLGLMGEAGPEAIMPLRRGRDGRLGVAGGSSTVVNYNVAAGVSRNEMVTALQLMQQSIEGRTAAQLRRAGIA